MNSSRKISKSEVTNQILKRLEHRRLKLLWRHAITSFSYPFKHLHCYSVYKHLFYKLLSQAVLGEQFQLRAKEIARCIAKRVLSKIENSKTLINLVLKLC